MQLHILQIALFWIVKQRMVNIWSRVVAEVRAVEKKKSDVKGKFWLHIMGFCDMLIIGIGEC